MTLGLDGEQDHWTEVSIAIASLDHGTTPYNVVRRRNASHASAITRRPTANSNSLVVLSAPCTGCQDRHTDNDVNLVTISDQGAICTRLAFGQVLTLNDRIQQGREERVATPVISRHSPVHYLLLPMPLRPLLAHQSSLRHWSLSNACWPLLQRLGCQSLTAEFARRTTWAGHSSTSRSQLTLYQTSEDLKWLRKTGDWGGTSQRDRPCARTDTT